MTVRQIVVDRPANVLSRFASTGVHFPFIACAGGYAVCEYPYILTLRATWLLSCYSVGPSPAMPARYPRFSMDGSLRLTFGELPQESSLEDMLANLGRRRRSSSLSSRRPGQPTRSFELTTVDKPRLFIDLIAAAPAIQAAHARGSSSLRSPFRGLGRNRGL